MTEVKNARMLPAGMFEFVDNGVLLTIVDSTSGNVVEKKVYEELSDALRTYRDKVNEFAKLIAKAENKPKEDEDL